MTYLRLIIDITNLISKMTKLGAYIIIEAYRVREDNTAGFIDIDGTPTEIGQSTP